MYRTPAICLLMLIQLIAGNGHAFYLCVSCDGQLAGICSGPLLCTNCHHKGCCGGDSASEESDESDEHHCCSIEHDGDEVDETSSPVQAVAEPQTCQCDHLLIASEVASSGLRVNAVDALAAMSLDALIVVPVSLMQAVVSGYAIPHYETPPDKQLSLVVLSTIVIRC